jgi:hypothetical protein
MIIDLGGATRTLAKLLRAGVAELEPGLVLPTTPAPPDVAAPGEVSVYLFHVVEAPEFKNLPSVGGAGDAATRHSPMGLILQYIIAIPYSADEQTIGVLQAQQAIGLIARVLHDYPVVDEALELDDPEGGVGPVLDAGLNGNALEIVLRPAKMDEVISFWAAQNQTTPRLSLFVEVRVAILEPRKPKFIPGTVYSIGGGSIANMGPRLFQARSELTFALPAGFGRSTETLTAIPARVALFDQAGTALAGGDPRANNNRVTFRASGLAPARTLVLEGQGQTLRVSLDPAHTQNADWAFSVAASELGMRVFRQLRALPKGEVAEQTVTLVPGVYSARVLQRDDRLGGIALSSTACPFAIVPQILSLTESAGEYTLTVVGDYLEAEDVEVELAVGGVRLALGEDPGNLGAGEFALGSVAGGGGEVDGVVRFRLPAGVAPAERAPVAVTLLVNAQTATPVWVEV